MMRISVPQYRLLNTHHERPYTVFQVEVYMSGKMHTVEKRYSEFHKLHKQLKKTIRTPVFPPKRVMNLNAKVLEERRLGLERYLQEIVRRGTIPKSLLVALGVSGSGGGGAPTTADLQVPHFGSDLTDVSSLEDSAGVLPSTQHPASHQPILSFNADPFLHPSVNVPPIALNQCYHQSLVNINYY